MRWDGTVGIGAPQENHQRLVAELVAEGCQVLGFPAWSRRHFIPTALRPDAYRLAGDILDVFEVVVSSPISSAKRTEYMRLVSQGREVALVVRVYRVDRHGRRRCIAAPSEDAITGEHQGPRLRQRRQKRGAQRGRKVPRPRKSAPPQGALDTR